MNSNRPIYININSMTVVKIIAIFALFGFAYYVREILAVFFVALVIASALTPWVDYLQKKKIPRPAGILLIYISMFLTFGIVVSLLIPPITQQMNDLSNRAPEIFDNVISGFEFVKNSLAEIGILDNIKEAFNSISSNFSGTAGGVVSKVSDVFKGIFGFFLILVITFYMVVEDNATKKIVWSLAPKKYQIPVMNVINKMQQKVVLWLRGQMILSLIIFILIFTGLKVIDWSTGYMQYALVLALLAAMTEFVPYLGPVIAAIPAVFLGFTHSFTLGIIIILLYSIIQWVENNIIVPQVMRKVVGLNPIISIAVLLIGFKLAGIFGVILAIPVATAASVLIKEVFDRKLIENEVKSGV